jgi:hypothetical protein
MAIWVTPQVKHIVKPYGRDVIQIHRLLKKPKITHKQMVPSFLPIRFVIKANIDLSQQGKRVYLYDAWSFRLFL